MNRPAGAIHEGDVIHVTPHDTFRNSPDPLPSTHCPDAVITVDAVIRRWTIVVICWHTGTARLATPYDADQLIELVRGAA